MSIFIPQRQVVQPSGPADVVLSGIGDGLSGAWLPYTVAAPVNLASGRPPVAVAIQATPTVGKAGLAFGSSAGGNAGYAYDNELLYPTDAVSVLALFETTANPSNNHRLCGSIHPTVSPFKGFGLDFSSSTNVRFSVSGSTFTSINGAFSSNLTLAIGTYDRVNMRLFVNGNQVASTAKSEAIDYNGTAFGLLRLTTNTTTFHSGQGFPGKLFLAAVWRRALQLDEIQSLTGNPWQIFRPPSARIYAFPGATGETKAVSDSGSGADAVAQVAVALGITDTGSGAETLPGAAAALGVTDAGSAADLLAALSAVLGVSDGGSGIDALAALAAALAVGDSATAADAVSIITEALFTITDSGAAADAIASIVAQLAVQDAGSGVDAIVNVATSLQVGDSGVGADSAPAIAALLALADGATGADAIAVLTETLKVITDSVSATDGLTVGVAVTLAETATGADVLQSIAALLALADGGAGIDVVARFDAAVRIVRLAFSFRRRHAVFRFARRSMQFQLAA